MTQQTSYTSPLRRLHPINLAMAASSRQVMTPMYPTTGHRHIQQQLSKSLMARSPSPPMLQPSTTRTLLAVPHNPRGNRLVEHTTRITQVQARRRQPSNLPQTRTTHMRLRKTPVRSRRRDENQQSLTTLTLLPRRTLKAPVPSRPLVETRRSHTIRTQVPARLTSTRDQPVKDMLLLQQQGQLRTADKPLCRTPTILMRQDQLHPSKHTTRMLLDPARSIVLLLSRPRQMSTTPTRRVHLLSSRSRRRQTCKQPYLADQPLTIHTHRHRSTSRRQSTCTRLAWTHMALEPHHHLKRTTSNRWEL